jgi:hypothetical protein
MHLTVHIQPLTSASNCGLRTWAPRMLATMLATVLCCGAFAVAEGTEDPKQPSARLIGATTVVTEVSTGLPLAARVDTGATCCSIHCETFEIKDAEADPRSNIGKPVRFLIKHRDGVGEWVEAKIVDHVTVRTSKHEDERYKVNLRLRVEDVEKKVQVTLNDRESMKFPLLLGRNFLRDDFLVNVSMNSTE